MTMKSSEYASYALDSNLGRQAETLAQDFTENQKQFQLGHLPTEQPHPYTRSFSEVVSRNAAEGISLLLDVDRDMPPVARRIVLSKEYDELVSAIGQTARDKRKICFSGCGSTGRLAMILEEMWRQYWEDRAGVQPGEAVEKKADGNADLIMADLASSIMTGGDRALIRSVENFEDYPASGERQLADLGLGEGDLLIAISEGGETSSVIGTAREALRRGCRVFFIFNNPAAILRESIERSRELIDDQRVTVIDLFTGSMSLTGSTRMQATSMEMFVVGSALEEAFQTLEGNVVNVQDRLNKVAQFASLIANLSGEKNLQTMGLLAALESSLYEKNGRITYLVPRFLLDIFSDTSERSPTFMLPPFRPSDDSSAAVSWAFAKDPSRSSKDAWFAMLRRKPRGIDWTGEDYAVIAPGTKLVDNPPSLGEAEISRYLIGYEEDESRHDCEFYEYLLILLGDHQYTSKDATMVLRIGGSADAETNRSYHINIELPASPVKLYEHLATKLVMNSISTASMGIMGRIRENWMVQLDPTNKKLIDRGSRIISHLTGLTYTQACSQLYRSILAREKHRNAGGHSITSPVVDALDRISSLD